MSIKSTGGDGREWRLLDEHGAELAVGRKLTSINSDDTYTLTGGRAPQHEGSTGRVHVIADRTGIRREFFPVVFGLEWVRT